MKRGLAGDHAVFRAQGSSAEGPVLDYFAFTSSPVWGDELDALGDAGRRALQATDVPGCFLGLIHHATLGFLVIMSRLPPRPTTLKVAGAAGLPGGR